MVTEETSLKFIDPTQRIRGAVAEIDVSYEIPAVSMVFLGHSIPNVLENQLFTIEMSDLLQKKTLVGWPMYPIFFTGDINHIPWRTRSCTTPEYFTSC